MDFTTTSTNFAREPDIEESTKTELYTAGRQVWLASQLEQLKQYEQEYWPEFVWKFSDKGDQSLDINHIKIVVNNHPTA